jgi:pSer/pThr/pTyr-binding forkhead associated (FHA) protein
MSRDRSTVTALLDDAPACSRQNRGGMFLVIKGPDRGTVITLADQPLSFGSGSQCSLVLNDTTVSRKHVEVQLVGDEVVMTDCGSKNGILIHGMRVEKAAIGFGAELKLGRTVIKFVPNEELSSPRRRTTRRSGRSSARMCACGRCSRCSRMSRRPTPPS